MITKNDIPNFAFKEYRKIGVTKLSDEILQKGMQVMTLEGEYTCAEPSRLAIDAAGNVYPVALSIVEKSYELAKERMSDISLAGRNEMPLSAMGAPQFRYHAGREEIFAELRRVGTMAVESRTSLIRIEQLCRLHPEPNAAMMVIAQVARDGLGMTKDEIDSVCKILG